MLNWTLLNRQQRAFGVILAIILAFSLYASALQETVASFTLMPFTNVFNFLSITFLLMGILLHPMSFQQPSLEKLTSISTPKICTVLFMLAIACWLLPLAANGFIKLAS